MYPQSLSPVQQVDFALFLVFLFSAVVLAILTMVTLYFLWRYNHKRNPVPSDIRGNTKVEIVWTVIPSLMVMGLFYYGWTGFQALRTVPPNAIEVGVTAKMFSWTFTYANGKNSNYLAVPTGTPVKLNMHSVDVIHSLFIPAFRIKMDTVPGLATYAWFKAEREGTYDIYCAEYCGVKHSAMLSTVRAMNNADFETWYAETGPGHGVEAGRALGEAQGCFACHAEDGSDTGSPPLHKLYGSVVTVIIDGKEKEITADEDYLKEAIIEPGKSIVKGYDNTMPPYADFSPEQMGDILSYMKSIGKDASEATEQGGKDAPEKNGVSSEGKDGSERKGAPSEGKDVPADKDASSNSTGRTGDGHAGHGVHAGQGDASK